MSNGGPRGARLEIIERPSTSIVRQLQIITSAGGANGKSVGVNPGAGVRWLIHHVAVLAKFNAAPGPNDRGSGIAELVTAGTTRQLIGAETDEDMDQAQVVRGTGTGFIMEPGDFFVARSDARASSVTVLCEAVIWGVQYTVY